MEEADFYGGGSFLQRRIVQRKQGFNQEHVCFTVCSSGTSGPP